MENLDVNILNKIVYCGISCTYIIKEIEKLVLCVYGVIMRLGNVGRTLEKRVKHSATPRVLHASLVFSQHFPRALSHHKRTRLVFYFLNKTKETIFIHNILIYPILKLITPYV